MISSDRSRRRGTVVHLTSVHPAFDNRIFHKECRSARSAGYEVVLIAPHDRSETVDDIRIRAVPPPRNRFVRVTLTTLAVGRAALEEPGEVYHFHDPELIPVGIVLRALRRRVVYDVHEDHTTSIAQKTYLPRPFRRGVAAVLGRLEQLLARCFEVVIAEKYYQRRFPRGLPVLNYPRKGLVPGPAIPMTFPDPGVARLLYTGVVSVDRGARNHVEILHLIPEAELTIVGRCPPPLGERLRAWAGDHADRLRLVGVGRFVPFSEILDHYRQGGWLAGLAVFPRTPHYEFKELTKFFEYMAAGIPVVCSDFPVWKSLIYENGVGLCVDPTVPAALRDAVRWLIDNPRAAREMGERGRDLSQRLCWEDEADKLIGRYDALVAGSSG